MAAPTGDFTLQLREAKLLQSALLTEFGADPGIQRLIESSGLSPA